MTREEFKNKALSLLLEEKFFSLPLFEAEGIEDFVVSDEQATLCFDEFLDKFYTVLEREVKI